MRGAGLTKTLLLIPAVLVLLLLLAVAFFEGRKAYWDYQVRGMCEKDGGVSIYEKVAVTRSQFQKWGGVGGVLGIPIQSDQRVDIPFFRQTKDETLRSGSPVFVLCY